MTAEKQNSDHDVDIDKQQIGKIYSKALLDASSKQGNSRDVVDELTSFVDDVIAQLPDLEATLASPRITSEEKSRLLDNGFQGRMSEQLLIFLKVVAKHGRLDCIRQISREARNALNEREGRVAIQVTTAEALDPRTQQQIAESIANALKMQVELRPRVDPDIIGGLVIRVGDTVYDGSVANHLQRVRRETVERVSVQIRESLDRFATAD